MGKIVLLSLYNIKLTFDQKWKLTQRSLMYDDPYKIHALKYVTFPLSVLICWNMPTFTADEICNGNLNPNTFAPTAYDMDNILDAVVASGSDRCVLTVKAHDGFMLWPSEQHAVGYDPYTIERTTWYANNGSPDITKEFCDGCRARGLRVGLYFSIWDKTHEIRTGTDETSDPAAYIAMIEEQLTELLTNYGQIDVLWFDGWIQMMVFAQIPYATIYNFIKGLQPHCVVINNRGNVAANQYVTDVVSYEFSVTGSILTDNPYVAEEIDTIRTDNLWYFHQGNGVADADYNSAASIKTLIDSAVSKNGTYVLGIQPGKDGLIPSAQAARLAELGAL